MSFFQRFHQSAFTLIELLVVIAIIAILAVVVVLALNPAQLLAQSRDVNRVSDMATLNTALGLYQADSGGTGSMGTSSIVYTSLSDASSTCGSLNLPTLSSSTYNCTVSTSSRFTNSTGWIPIDFTKISAGTPLGSLPVDPINSSSTGLYYTYNTSSSLFMVSALPESTKQKTALGANPLIPNYPGVIANGDSITINPLFNASGLVGYWPMDEGVGSTTRDMSGNNNLGSWAGTPAGTNNTYYAAGKVGPWAGAFDGSSNYINIPTSSSLQYPGNQFTYVAWLKTSSPSATQGVMSQTGGGSWIDTIVSGNAVRYEVAPTSYTSTPQVYTSSISSNSWYQAVVTYNGVTITGYLNGVFQGSRIPGGSGFSSNPVIIGSYGGRFTGLIDDVRIYNRVLSVAEVQALYNAVK